MKHIIVALVGFKGSGKDTVGAIFKKEYGYSSTSFAKPLKSVLGKMFDWDDSLLEGLTPESRAWREQPDEYWSQHFKRTVTPRTMMQEFGTEIVRNHLNNDFWTFRCQKDLEKINNNIVVTDARFLNEIQMIRDLGGLIVWVKRDLPPYYKEAMFLNKLPNIIKPFVKLFLRRLVNIHPSEYAWIGTDFDYIIENNGTIVDLESKVKTFVETTELAGP